MPAVIATKNLSTLPQLVSKRKTYEDDFPRCESLRTKLKVGQAKSLRVATPPRFLEAVNTNSKVFFNLFELLEIGYVLYR